MNEKILMKNGVALWLINNTDLSSEQIGDFCNIHPLQIEHMKYENGAKHIVECNPIASLILEEKVIEECEKDTNKRLTQMESSDFSRRKISDKTFTVHNAILWLLNKNPSYQASKIAKLLHCSVATVKLIQNKEFKHIDELTPQNPVANGLCSSEELDIFLNEN